MEERSRGLEVPLPSSLSYLGSRGQQRCRLPGHVLGLFWESSETFLRQMTPAMYSVLELEHPQQKNAATDFRLEL